MSKKTQATTSRDTADALAIIFRGRTKQRIICDDLELIADQLGGSVNRQLCSLALDKLNHHFELYQKDEEALYEILRIGDSDDQLVARSIEQALSDHRRHVDYVLEVAEPLNDICLGQEIENPEALGYLLRCFFESLRWHMEWEDATLLGSRLPPLTSEEMSMLRAHLARNRSALARHLRIAK